MPWNSTFETISLGMCLNNSPYHELCNSPWDKLIFGGVDGLLCVCYPFFTLSSGSWWLWLEELKLASVAKLIGLIATNILYKHWLMMHYQIQLRVKLRDKGFNLWFLMLHWRNYCWSNFKRERNLTPKFDEMFSLYEVCACVSLKNNWQV